MTASSPRPRPDDEIGAAVLRRAQRGDAAACRALVEHYQYRLFAELTRRLDDAAVRAQVAEDTLAQVLAELAGFPALGPARPSARIVAVAVQRALAAGGHDPDPAHGRSELRPCEIDRPVPGADAGGRTPQRGSPLLGRRSGAGAVVIPAGFAAAVVERHLSSAPPRRRRFGWGPLPRAAWLVPAACAGLLLVLVVRGSPPAVSGEARAAVRQSLRLGERGVAVVEPGAALRWRIGGGSARIEQSAGAAFYRIEGSAPLWIATPAGDVRTSDSCITVSVTAGAVTLVVHQGNALFGGRTIGAGARVSSP